MRLTKVMLASLVSIGLVGGCAERPGTKKDDKKADKDKKAGAKAAGDKKPDAKAKPE